MAIVKEPKGIDFVVNSHPWSDVEVKEFWEIIAKKKAELGEKNRARINERFKKTQTILD